MFLTAERPETENVILGKRSENGPDKKCMLHQKDFSLVCLNKKLKWVESK